MRVELLDILRCPACRENSFRIEDGKRDAFELIEGKILCTYCRSAFEVKDGIVDLLYKPSASVSRERQAMDREGYLRDSEGNLYKLSDETVEKFRDKFLSLPQGDGSYFFKKGGPFEFIAGNSARFYKTFNELSLTGRESVLEVGAGFSWASYIFARKGCKVVALDISNYLRVSRIYIKEAYFDRIFSDMHAMPFLDGTFDIVFASSSLHHTKNLKAVFSEIYRVLKPGGRFILINESARGILERPHPGLEMLRKKGFQDTSYTILHWRRCARHAGFRKNRIEFLPIADDYIMKHRDSIPGFKVNLAQFIRRHHNLGNFLSFFLRYPRIFFRPKSWRMFCYKDIITIL